MMLPPQKWENDDEFSASIQPNDTANGNCCCSCVMDGSAVDIELVNECKTDFCSHLQQQLGHLQLEMNSPVSKAVPAKSSQKTSFERGFASFLDSFHSTADTRTCWTLQSDGKIDFPQVPQSFVPLTPLLPLVHRNTQCWWWQNSWNNFFLYWSTLTILSHDNFSLFFFRSQTHGFILLLYSFFILFKQVYLHRWRFSFDISLGSVCVMEVDI